MNDSLHGTWFVVPTAFSESGEIDLDGQRQLIHSVSNWGVDGLTVMGVMSESSLLTNDERRLLLAAIFDEVENRLPIVVGCVAGGARGVADLAVQAAELGAAAVMIAPPHLHRNIAGLPDFFSSVARRSGGRILIQDEPRAFGVVMPPPVLAEAYSAADAVGVKLEDPPTPEKISQLLALAPGAPVFGGLGGASALWELRRGSCGTMTGFAFPEILRAVRLAHESGRSDEAGLIFNRYLPLIQFEAQVSVGLAIRKEVLRRRGALPTAVSRLFPRGIDPRAYAELDDVLRWVGIEPSPERFAAV